MDIFPGSGKREFGGGGVGIWGQGGLNEMFLSFHVDQMCCEFRVCLFRSSSIHYSLNLREKGSQWVFADSLIDDSAIPDMTNLGTGWDNRKRRKRLF